MTLLSDAAVRLGIKTPGMKYRGLDIAGAAGPSGALLATLTPNGAAGTFPNLKQGLIFQRTSGQGVFGVDGVSYNVAGGSGDLYVQLQADGNIGLIDGIATPAILRTIIVPEADVVTNEWAALALDSPLVDLPDGTTWSTTVWRSSLGRDSFTLGSLDVAGFTLSGTRYISNADPLVRATSTSAGVYYGIAVPHIT